MVKLHNLTVAIRSIFQKDNKYYPKMFFDECSYELWMLQYDKIDISEGIDINKTNALKKCDMCHHTNHILAMAVMI